MILATNNPGKAREFNAMLQSEGVEISALSDLGLVFVPKETGTTFEENAVQKTFETAAFLAEVKDEDRHSNPHARLEAGCGYTEIVLADDSGLEIDALNGDPGVDSALFMGADTPQNTRNAKVLALMADVPESERTARFVCVIACALPDGRVFTTRGELEGIISHEQKGADGFGYDPIFFLPSHGKTMAELSKEEKNKLSHRGKAFSRMIEKLKEENVILK